MTDRQFVVRAVVEVEWLNVTAASADAAAAAVEDGVRGAPDEFTGWREITEVVSVEMAADPRAGDERKRCACGHLWTDDHRGVFSKLGRRRRTGEKPKLNPQACTYCSCSAPVVADVAS